MSEAKLLFIAARVSAATANALAGAAQTLSRRTRDAGLDVRWVAPESYHVTLKYLGWTRVEAIEAVRDALVEAGRGTPRLSLRVGKLGAFPSLDKASVVWAGVDGDAALVALVGRIEAAMVELGFAAETRPFQPHVTLGRLKETRPLKEVVLPLAEQMFGESRIEAVTLFESETKSSGSVYREVARIEFKPAEIAAGDTAERQTRGVDLGARNAADGAHDAGEDTDDGWPRSRGPN